MFKRNFTEEQQMFREAYRKFLAQEIVLGKLFQHVPVNGFLRGQVGFGDQVGRGLLAGLEAVGPIQQDSAAETGGRLANLNKLRHGDSWC